MSGTLDIGIRNTAQGIWNLSNEWNMTENPECSSCNSDSEGGNPECKTVSDSLTLYGGRRTSLYKHILSRATLQYEQPSYREDTWTCCRLFGRTRELKHHTFLIYERHGWPRRTGSGTRFMRQMQIIKQTNVKPSRMPT